MSTSKKTTASSIKLPSLEGLDSLLYDSNITQATSICDENEHCLSVDGFRPNVEKTRVKVKILKVVNPGEIYVAFPDLLKKIAE